MCLDWREIRLHLNLGIQMISSREVAVVEADQGIQALGIRSVNPGIAVTGLAVKIATGVGTTGAKVDMVVGGLGVRIGREAGVSVVQRIGRIMRREIGKGAGLEATAEIGITSAEAKGVENLVS